MKRMLVPLAAWCAALAFTWPGALLVSDEQSYVGQAVLWAHGSARVVSTYPPGTSLLQTPFVALFGWRGAYAASALALVATTLLLVHWLRREGRDPVFALAFLGFVPALVLGRVAMSDLPSALIVTAAAVLLARGNAWGGLLAGLSLLFRESNVLLLAPWLTVSALPLFAAGVAVRLGASAWLFGSPFFTRPHGYDFSLAHVLHNAPLHAVALLVLVPGGLWAATRRKRVLASTVLCLALYLPYGYSAEEAGLLKQLVLGLRYFVPLAPLLAVALAQAAPRLQRLPWATLVTLAAVGANVVLARYERSARAIVEAVRAHVPAGGTVLLDPVVSEKYADPVLTGLHTVDFTRDATPVNGARLLLVDRTDSGFFRDRSAQGERVLQALEARCSVTKLYDAGEIRARIFALDACR